MGNCKTRKIDTDSKYYFNDIEDLSTVGIDGAIPENIDIPPEKIPDKNTGFQIYKNENEIAKQIEENIINTTTDLKKLKDEARALGEECNKFKEQRLDEEMEKRTEIISQKINEKRKTGLTSILSTKVSTKIFRWIKGGWRRKEEKRRRRKEKIGRRSQEKRRRREKERRRK